MKRLPILLLILFVLAGCGKTVVSTDLIRKNFIEEVASYHPGTAGSSLKQATAASNVLRFATEQKMRNADCKTAMEKAWKETDADTQEYFLENYEGLSWLITTAFSDYDSVDNMFEDAGVVERMKTALGEAEAEKDWAALRSAAEDVLSGS